MFNIVSKEKSTLIMVKTLEEYSQDVKQSMALKMGLALIFC